MPIRVLIVDDSVFFQRRLQSMLAKDPSIKVVGVAGDGVEAIRQARFLKPDVITMDVEMPKMNGITAVRQIMQLCPTAILMVSAMTVQGACETFDALEAGAIDFIPKDFHRTADNTQAHRVLCDKIISVANRHNAGEVSVSAQYCPVPETAKPAVNQLNRFDVLAVGASTGGPIAIQELLCHIPRVFPLPIVIVQHMPGNFTPMFAERLDNLCQIDVKEADHGDILQKGRAYIAPGGMQMTFNRNGPQTQILISESDPTLFYKPSVDVTYKSLADVHPGKVLAIVLTGMGSDGCEGARRLKKSGSSVWAQDEASSVVYGMPMAVARAGLADQILSLNNISAALERGF